MAVVLEFRSRAAQVLSDQEKMIDKANKLKKGYSETGKEAGNLGRTLTKLLRDIESPQERYNRKLKELPALLASGRIGVDEMRRAVELYNRELHEAEDQGDKAFGAAALGKITAITGGLFTAGGAIAAVTAQLREFVRERDEAADRTLRSRRGLAQLSQLFAGDEAGFKGSLEEARQFFGTGAVADEGEAGGIVFNLMSAGADKESRDLFRQLAAAGTIAEPGAAAEAAAAIRSAMGQDQTGSFRDVLNKALVAAGPGSSTLEQLLVGAAKAGPGGRFLGVSDEEVMAATGVLSKPFASASIGGERLAALFRSFERAGLKGSLSDMLTATQARLDKGEEWKDIFETRDQEAVDAFRNLMLNRGDLAALTRDVAAAPGRNVVDAAMRVTETDPVLESARTRQAVTQRSDLATQMQTGRATNLLQAFLEETRGRGARDPGVMTAAGQAFGEFATWLRRMTDGDVYALSQMRSEVTPQDPELKKAIDEFLAEAREQTATLKRIEEKQSARPPVTRVQGRQE